MNHVFGWTNFCDACAVAREEVDDNLAPKECAGRETPQLHIERWKREAAAMLRWFGWRCDRIVSEACRP